MPHHLHHPTFMEQRMMQATAATTATGDQRAQGAGRVSRWGDPDVWDPPSMEVGAEGMGAYGLLEGEKCMERHLRRTPPPQGDPFAPISPRSRRNSKRRVDLERLRRLSFSRVSHEDLYP